MKNENRNLSGGLANLANLAKQAAKAASNPRDDARHNLMQALDRARQVSGVGLDLQTLLMHAGDELLSDWVDGYAPHMTPEFLECFCKLVEANKDRVRTRVNNNLGDVILL